MRQSQLIHYQIKWRKNLLSVFPSKFYVLLWYEGNYFQITSILLKYFKLFVAALIKMQMVNEIDRMEVSEVQWKMTKGFLICLHELSCRTISQIFEY